ncbi:hypothetical protein ACLQ26_01525 [Micromonospora sp. DT43]|uniref:hypothetical protein n=1 Tax=Micromonospora sp. DT43 TaxID=3393440 RepID=UPI003CF62DA0
MEIWSHDGKLYEINSYYSLPDDAWQYELAGLTGNPGAGPYLAILIPDATSDDGPFTPVAADQARVSLGGGQLSWPILHRFIAMVEASGDLVAEQRDAVFRRFIDAVRASGHIVGADNEGSLDHAR